MRWYISQNGNTTGPLTEERIAMLVTWGKISRDAYVCDEQLSTWVGITRTAFGSLFPEPAPQSSDAGAESAAPQADAPRSPGQHRAMIAGFVLMAGAIALAFAAT